MPTPAGKPEKRDISLTDEQKNLIATQLVQRRAAGPCARCGYPTMTIHNRLTYLGLQQLADAVRGDVHESSVKAVLLVCANCGWIAMHALGLLGLKDLEPGPDGTVPTPDPPIVQWPADE